MLPSFSTLSQQTIAAMNDWRHSLTVPKECGRSAAAARDVDHVQRGLRLLGTQQGAMRAGNRIPLFHSPPVHRCAAELPRRRTVSQAVRFSLAVNRAGLWTVLQIHWHPMLPGGGRSSSRPVITIRRTDTVTTAVEINTIRATRIIATTGTTGTPAVSLLKKGIYNKELATEPAPATAVSAQASLHFVKMELYMCSPGLTRLTGRDGHGWMGACRQGQVTNRLSRARTTPAMGIIGEP